MPTAFNIINIHRSYIPQCMKYLHVYDTLQRVVRGELDTPLKRLSFHIRTNICIKKQVWSEQRAGKKGEEGQNFRS